MLVAQAVKFTKGAKTQIALIPTLTASQAELVVLLANGGTRGLVRVPHEDNECRRVFQAYGRFASEREDQVRKLIAERTADEETQQDVYQALLPMLLDAKRP